MTFTISKSKLAVAIIAVALAVPSTAMAFHVFDDVADDKFYADPVEWAFDNGITTGKSADLFAPDDGVTRGEAVTFLKRYNDNVVEPAVMSNETAAAAAQAAADAAQADADENRGDIAALGPMHWASIASDGSINSRSSGVNNDVAQTGRISEGQYQVDFEVDDVAQCHAMVSRTDTTSFSASVGTIHAEMRSGDSSSMFVRTTDEAGTNEDSPFTIQLWCQPADNEIVIIALGAVDGPLGQGD